MRAQQAAAGWEMHRRDAPEVSSVAGETDARLGALYEKSVPVHTRHTEGSIQGTNHSPCVRATAADPGIKQV